MLLKCGKVKIEFTENELAEIVGDLSKIEPSSSAKRLLRICDILGIQPYPKMNKQRR